MKFFELWSVVDVLHQFLSGCFPFLDVDDINWCDHIPGICTGTTDVTSNTDDGETDVLGNMYNI